MLWSAGDSGFLFETLSPSSSDSDNDEEYLPENDSSCHRVMKSSISSTAVCFAVSATLLYTVVT